MPQASSALVSLRRDAWTKPFIRALLCVALFAGALLLPFLPGRYDPLATSLSAAATGVTFGSILLVPVGVAWLVAGREHALAKLALAAATLAVAGGALLAAASGSIAAGAILITTWTLLLTGWWRRVRGARTAGVRVPRARPIALIVLPFVAVAVRSTVVPYAESWSRDRAIANAAALISDIERYRGRTGAYPDALSSVWPDYQPGIIGIERYRYEPSGEGYNVYFEQPSAIFGAREIVMYNPLGHQDISSHAVDLLRLEPDEIRRQRGYFASHDLPRAGWKRFLFD